MSNFNWTTQARDAAAFFHDAEIMVYVEGSSDIPFWDHVISEFTDKRIKISSLGDKPSLLKYLHEKEVGSEYLIAMDSDYDQLFEKLSNSDVLLTYGYSIENTIIVPGVMRELIASYKKVQKTTINMDSLKDWILEFESVSERLLAADLENKKGGAEQQNIIPDNASRFFEGGELNLDSEKIGSYLAEKGFEQDSLSCRQSLRHWRVAESIKGHFLFSAVQRFVTKCTGVSISNSAFYASCISGFEKHFDSNHAHYQYYKDMVNFHVNK